MFTARNVLGLRRLAQDQRGASAVEFALISIVLAMFLVGIVQFGITFSQWIQLEHAAREGARWASLWNTTSTVRTVVKDSAPGLALTDADITIDPNPGTLAPPGAGYVTDTPVKVTVRYKSPIVAPMMHDVLSQDGTWSITLVASATQKIE